MRYRASPAQRELIERLLREQELLTVSISLIHRAAFENADLWCSSDQGQSLQGWLSQLTSGQAGRLIDALKRRKETI